MQNEFYLAVSIEANEAFFVWGLIFGLEIDVIDCKYGSEITVTEFMTWIMPWFDKEITRTCIPVLKKIGFKVQFNIEVTVIELIKYSNFKY